MFYLWPLHTVELSNRTLLLEKKNLRQREVGCAVCFQPCLCTCTRWSMILQSRAWISYCLQPGLPCLPTSPPSNSSRRSSQTKICMCDPFLLNICQLLFPIAFRIKPKFLIMIYPNRFGLCLFLRLHPSSAFSHPALQTYWPSVFISQTYSALSYSRASYPWDPPILPLHLQFHSHHNFV